MTPTATPSPPAGTYAFARGSQIWVKQGDIPPFALADLNLGQVSATWGQFSWSPGQNALAFVLRAPPFAPGDPSATPEQGTGALYILDLRSRALTQIRDSDSPISVPLLGRHLAWQTADTLLFTQRGVVYRVSLKAETTVTQVPGPRFAWEIAVRGTTLFYSSIPQLTTLGVGTALLIRRDLTDLGVPGNELIAATFGPASAPPQTCGFVCPADPTTPYVPYAWDVSADGTQIVYQSTVPVVRAPPAPTPTATLPTPSPTKSPPATPGTTPTPTLTPTPSATPSPQPTPIDATTAPYYLRVKDGAPQPLTRLTAHPTLPVLTFAPNGMALALSSPPAPQTPGIVASPPVVLRLDSVALPQNLMLPAPTDMPIGALSWAPDSASITLPVQPAVGQDGLVGAYDLSIASAGQEPILVERGVATFAWATP